METRRELGFARRSADRFAARAALGPVTPLLSLSILLLGAASLAGAQVKPEVERTVRTLHERGEWAGVIRAASEANELSKDLYLYQGLALAHLGRLDDAEKAFLHARQTYPGDPRFALELAGIAYRNKDFAVAKNYLHDALRLSPADNYGNDFLASLYILDGNLEAALKYWNRTGQPLIQTFQFAPDLDLNPLLRERAFAISPGQIFTRNRLLMTQANLDRLGVLSSYQFDLTPRPDQRFDVTFRSLQTVRPGNVWLGQVLPAASGLPFRTIYFDHDNFGQQAINLTSLWRWDPNKRRVALNLSGPIRLNPRWRYRFAVAARDANC